MSELQTEVRHLILNCGAHLISAFRPGAVVAGTHRASLHSTWPARAADLSGNPGCIYAHLRGWQGGYSTDYRRVKHVHVSYEPHGREWGARFAHGNHHRHRYYARHRSSPPHVAMGWLTMSRAGMR